MDGAIEIMPGTKLPKPNMIPREIEELRSFIDKNLIRGFIQTAKLRVATSVLFKGKNDGFLRICMDYRGINAICVEDM